MTVVHHRTRSALVAALAVVLGSCAGSEISNPTVDAGSLSCAVDNGGCGPISAWYCADRAGQAPACVDRNECQVLPYPCSETPLVSCTNTIGGFECGTCPPGYAGDGMTCTNIDDCATNNGGCGDPRFYACTDLVNLPPTCTDIDECAVDNGGCGPASAWRCTNLVGQAPACTDIDECATPGFCSTNPMVPCTNLVGGFTCGACPSGYSGDGRTCTDINECVLDTDGCLNTAVCNNNAGSFSCVTCPLANQVASNAPSAYESCTCANGYVLLDGACKPICSYGATRWVVSSNNVIYDNSSRLYWQRIQPFTQYSEVDAVTYCANLVLDGWSDWRLPTRTELLTTVDLSSSPTTSGCAFPYASATYYWTSTLLATDYYYTVSFQTGMSSSAFSSNLLDVRCVR